MTTAIVTLTTDFGLSDEFVGALKGVLLSSLDSLTIVDISHAIRPQDILHASMVLAQSVPFFPQGTVHLAVVDPGVGSSRRIVAISTGGQLLVGPDNGLFTPFLRDDASLVHHVTNDDLFRKPISPTFHGRDIMAPVAAQLAGGMDISRVGQRIPRESCIQLSGFTSCRIGDTIIGQVVARDHFGNLRTNITDKEVRNLPGSGGITLRTGELQIDGLNSVYAERQSGELIALIDSQGFVEIAVVDGDAAAHTGIGTGGKIIITRRRRLF